MSTGKICGDAGGVSRNGEPCKQVTGGGRCRHHTDEATERLNDIKTRFLEMIRDPLMSKDVSAIRCGSSISTIWRMRQDDPAFDAEVTRIHLDADRLRIESVEDSLYARIVSGGASGTETIFWLMNRAPDRWKDKRNVDITTGDKPIKFTLNIENGNGNGDNAV